jgi:hypothetical protein
MAMTIIMVVRTRETTMTITAIGHNHNSDDEASDAI